MTHRRFTVLLWLGLLLGLAGLLTEPAYAQTVPGCSTAPAPVSPTGLADDAIETRNQRIEDAANCEALAARLDRLTERVDLAWWGAWASVGLLLTLIVAPMMWAAFRWWRE